MKPSHLEEPCLTCKAEAQALKTDTGVVSWCENGHVIVDDYNRLPQAKIVYNFGEAL